MANDLLIKAATYNYPESIPVGFGFLPAVFIKYGDKVKKIIAKYEDMLGNWWQNYDPYAHLSESYRKGGYTDRWGCVWSNLRQPQSSVCPAMGI